MPSRNAVVLLATDGSLPALAATKMAIQLAKSMNAKVVAVQVKEQVPMLPIEKAAEEVAEHPLHKMHVDGPAVAKEYGERNGVEVETRYLEGVPVAGLILKTAEEVGAKIIVIGDTGRRGFERLVMGSVAEAIVKHAKVPVFVVKFTSEEEISDVIEIAKKYTKPVEITLPPKPVAAAPVIGRNLALSLAFAIAFLIPYFGLSLLNSVAKTLASTEIIPGVTLSLLLAYLLFPIAWIVSISYNKVIEKIMG